MKKASKAVKSAAHTVGKGAEAGIKTLLGKRKKIVGEEEMLKRQRDKYRRWGVKELTWDDLKVLEAELSAWLTGCVLLILVERGHRVVFVHRRYSTDDAMVTPFPGPLMLLMHVHAARERGSASPACCLGAASASSVSRPESLT
eukprot:COSAG01_NODE_11020_length_2026_cov_1.148936_2_plen_144_part_00